MQKSLFNLVYNLAELNKNLPDDVLISKFYNTYQFCDNNIHKFKLSLRKEVNPFEYMDTWKTFNESVPLKKELSEVKDENINGCSLHLSFLEKYSKKCW